MKNLISVLCILFLTSCTHTPPKNIPPADWNAWKNHMQKKVQFLKTVEANFFLRLENSKQSINGRASLKASLPHWLESEIRDPLGRPHLLLRKQEKDFHVLYLQQKKAFVDPSLGKVFFKKHIHLPLEATELFYLAFGILPKNWIGNFNIQTLPSSDDGQWVGSWLWNDVAIKAWVNPEKLEVEKLTLSSALFEVTLAWKDFIPMIQNSEFRIANAFTATAQNPSPKKVEIFWQKISFNNLNPKSGPVDLPQDFQKQTLKD